MGSRLINCRLDATRLRKAEALRASGVTISDVLREAIDERFARLEKATAPRDIKEIYRALFAKYPDPPDFTPPQYDTRDRKQVQEEIVGQLKAKQKKAYADLKDASRNRKKAI